MLNLHPLLGENALFADIGKVFHPLFLLFGWILAGIYAVIPNYAVAIAGLTVVIMLALTPVTVKSTKSMIALQRLQPEMKKLQAKFKGPENREQLNAEMMKLYKENGTSPFGSCLPMFLQLPFLAVLYQLIRGLTNITKPLHGLAYANPRNIDPGTRIFKDLVASYNHSASPKVIHMSSHIFGMDLAQTPLNHHGSNQALLVLPYLGLLAISVFLQYYQMKQMNSRNPQAAAANPQMQTMQKFFPLLFAVIYLNFPTGAIIYMLVSSAMRIGTQEVMFRTGMVTPVAAEREIGASSKTKPDKPEASKPALPAAAPKKKTTVSDGTGVARQGTAPPKRSGGASNGRRPGGSRQGAATNGANGSAADGTEATPAPKAHPRSRSKRTRKAR